MTTNQSSATVVNGATNTNRSANAHFMTLAEFKKLVLGDTSAKLPIVKNPHTGKLFVAAGAKNYKIQASLVVETTPGVFAVRIPDGKEVKFLYTDEDIDNGCIILATKSNNQVAVL